MVNRLTATRHRANITLAICALLFALSTTAAGFAFIDRFSQTDARRAQQQEFNQRIVDSQVNFICFFKQFVVTQPSTPPTAEDKKKTERFFSGALHSVGAPATSCEKRPGNPP